MKFIIEVIIEVLKTVAAMLITAVVMLIFPIGVFMAFISPLFESTNDDID